MNEKNNSAHILQILQSITSLSLERQNFLKYSMILKEINMMIDFLTKSSSSPSLEMIEEKIGLFQPQARIFFLTLLLKTQKKTKYYNEALRVSLSSALSKNAKYYLWYQLASVGFTNTTIGDKETKTLSWDSYKQIYNEFKTELSNSLKFIPKEERNKKLIVFITAQFLSLNHAPTKSVLDRAYYVKKLGYEPFIINTADILSQAGAIPTYNPVTPNIAEAFDGTMTMRYLDEDIPYFQCSKNMPNIQEMTMVITIINEYKPWIIFNIGSSNITADICSNIVPVGTISTVFSYLPVTFSQFHITGRPISQDDIDFASLYGFEKDNLIHNLFTSSFKPQTKKLTRKDFNLPEEKFIIAVVGGRLDEEVTEKFIGLLLKTIQFNCYTVFVGCFNKYDQICAQNKKLKDHSSYLGFQDDMLAILELCNFYINPKRNGGGMSAVEALHKGVPVITYKYGDVYTNVGDDFAVENDEEVLKTLERYIDDEAFYREQVEKGEKKSQELTDTKEATRALIKKIENNPLFQ